MKKNLVFAISIAVLGLLVAVAPYSFAKVCEVGEKIMKCHWTARIELFLGISSVVLAVLKVISADAKYQIALNSALALNALGVILVPTVLIGVCGKATMHCHSVTRPTEIVFGILIFVISAAQTVILWKKR